MKLTDVSIRFSGQLLLGLATFIFSAAPAFGQTLKLTTPAQAEMGSSIGEYLALDEVPSPAWQEEAGAHVARLRIVAPEASAWRVAFRSMSLGKGTQMFLYGVDADTTVRAVHGPYEGLGPLNVPQFETQVIEGAEIVIELRGGNSTAEWPFQIESVERINASQLAALKQNGLKLEPFYQPENVERPASEVRSTWVGDELVRYQVIDGLAIMESDIVLGPAAEVESGATGKSNGRREAHEIISSSRRWPNGVMAYTIAYSSTGIMAGSVLEANILGAINYWNQRFPGILVQRTTQADYATFRFVSGVCRSSVGRQGGQQYIELTTGCSQGNIVHEIAHSLGMFHEHTRPDRDTFVRILWNNIQSGKSHNFEIPSSGTSRGPGTYDYGSIMHYATTDFGIDGKTTIQLLQTPPSGVTVGQRSGLSAGDEAGIRSRYCNAANWTIPSTVYASALGGTYSFTVTAPPYCTWSMSENLTWLTLSGTTTRTGSSRVWFSVSVNYGQVRSGIIRIYGAGGWDSVTVSQKGENTNY